MTRYPEDTPISKEAFERCGWQAALDTVNREDYSSMWSALSSAAREAIEEQRLPEGRVLWLLADACSIMLKPSSLNEPFAPFTVMNGKRSALPEDLTQEDIDFLSSIYKDINDSKLQARISDLIWLVKKPKDPQAALTAIDAYRQVPINTESWIRDGRECWDRAIQLCLMLRAGAGDRIQEVEDVLQASLLGTKNSDGNLPLWIADLMHKNGLGKAVAVEICEHLENLATEYADKGDLFRSRDHYEAAEEWYERVGNKEKSAEMSVHCAETWANEAVARQSSDSSPSHMVAASFYENAIQKYRTVPRRYRESHNVDARIEELRSRLNEAGEKSLGEMGVISSDPIDISDLVENSRKLVRGKNLVEALLSLSNVYHGAKVEKVRTYSKELMESHPLQALFSATHMSSDGRVIAKRPGADLGGEQSDQALWAEMVKHYIMELGIVVQGDVWPALEVVRSEHRIREQDFVALARQSPIIPTGRERLVGKALFAGYDNDFVTALHILVPQLEHLVRFHLKQAGIKTTNLDPNGIENENGLSTLMDHHKVEDIFGEDLAFEIRALFCDPFGPNLRNELAHGLVGFAEAQSTYAIYAWWLILKLTFNTYWNSTQESDDEADGDSADDAENA